MSPAAIRAAYDLGGEEAVVVALAPVFEMGHDHVSYVVKLLRIEQAERELAQAEDPYRVEHLTQVLKALMRS